MRTRSRALPAIVVSGGTIRPVYYYGVGLRFGAYAATPAGERFAGLHESADRACVAITVYPGSGVGSAARRQAYATLRARLVCHLARDCIMRLDRTIATLQATA